jgi:hypothetical protein
MNSIGALNWPNTITLSVDDRILLLHTHMDIQNQSQQH